MKNKLLMFLLVYGFSLSGNTYASIFISEYIEGSSNNKALEFFNSGDAIDFANELYTVEIYTNGGVTPSRSISLVGNIAANGIFVLAHSSADAVLTSIANLLSSSLSFNGDDAIALLHNGEIVDRIGQIGFDPGVEWGEGETSTQNNTLVRNSDIISGDNAAFGAFDPVTQWKGFSQDNFSFLGLHVLDNQKAPPIVSPDPVDVPTMGTLFLFVLGLLLLILHVTFNTSLKHHSDNRTQPVS